MTPERNRTRIIRLYRMEELLITESEGLTVTEICNHFQVDRRTIYRDIALMDELGIPLYKEAGKYKILGTYKIPSYRPQIAALV